MLRRLRPSNLIKIHLGGDVVVYPRVERAGGVDLSIVALASSRASMVQFGPDVRTFDRSGPASYSVMKSTSSGMAFLSHSKQPKSVIPNVLWAFVWSCATLGRELIYAFRRCPSDSC